MEEWMFWEHRGMESGYDAWNYQLLDLDSATKRNLIVFYRKPKIRLDFNVNCMSTNYYN